MDLCFSKAGELDVCEINELSDTGLKPVEVKGQIGGQLVDRPLAVDLKKV